jgi:hypothetical protein
MLRGMTTKTHTSHLYLVKGTYLVKQPQNENDLKESGRKVVRATSELKAIMAAANEFMAGHNCAMFTWLKVEAERIER